jgi:hypothetical protein
LEKTSWMVGRRRVANGMFRNCRVGGFCFGIPAKSIVSGNFDFVDLYATKLSETETNVVPIVLGVDYEYYSR